MKILALLLALATAQAPTPTAPVEAPKPAVAPPGSQIPPFEKLDPDAAPTAEQIKEAVIDHLLKGVEGECKGKKDCIPAMGLNGTVNELMADGVETFLVAAQFYGAKAVIIKISSPGGYLEEAEKIIAAIKGSKVPVHCVADEMAMSAAFWILQTCTERVATLHTKLMIHEPYGVFATPKITIKQLRHLADELEEGYKKIIADVAPRLKLSSEQFRLRLSIGDWDMSPPVAVANHALDRIVLDLPTYRQMVKDKYAPKVPVR
jgi:ATP-dependent protease ClpP protease subunit